jgi:hypothetical protein
MAGMAAWVAREHGLEVHRHHAVPVVLGGLEHVLARFDAHVVVEHVEPAVALEGGRDHGAAVGGPRHVRREGGGPAALADDDAHGFLCAVLLDVHTQHGGALAREEDGGGLAVAEPGAAGARSRHDRDLAGEAASHRGAAARAQPLKALSMCTSTR